MITVTLSAVIPAANLTCKFEFFFLHFSHPSIVEQVQRVGEKKLHFTMHSTMVPPEMKVTSYHLQFIVVDST